MSLRLRSVSVAVTLLGSVAFVAGCGARPPPGGGPGPEEPVRFSFAVLADPHLATDARREQRLTSLVSWLNQEAGERNIELVLVLGDLGWKAGLEKARDVLGELSVPWVPLLGDNEVHLGDERDFDRVFGAQLAALAGTFPGWTRAPSPVVDPSTGRENWLVNFAFEHRGVRFVALDFVSRADGLSGEFGEVHDYPGGTLPWLESLLAASAAGPADGIVLASHLPMHGGPFGEPAMQRFAQVLGPHRDRIRANVAGHLHISYEGTVADLFEVFVTAATWANEEAVRIFRVEGGPAGFEYEQELVAVPF